MTASNANSALLRAAQQQQFLDVVERDEAERRFRQHLPSNLSVRSRFLWQTPLAACFHGT